MPDWTDTTGRRLASLNLPPTREAEILEELAEHAEDRYQELLRGGAAEADARRLTLEELGDDELLVRELRGVEPPSVAEPVVLGGGERGSLLSDLVQDLRYGFRMLRKTPPSPSPR